MIINLGLFIVARESKYIINKLNNKPLNQSDNNTIRDP